MGWRGDFGVDEFIGNTRLVKPLERFLAGAAGGDTVYLQRHDDNWGDPVW